MNLANSWKDYKILDMSDGMKLESWNGIILSRPDPQIIWDEKTNPKLWNKANAIYHRSKTGGGTWEYNKKMPQQWQIKYKDLTFNIKPMGFKHTGLFPEQAVNWDWMMDKIKNAKREIKVLNLFAYTGGATVACSAAGASVCHVDSSKGMVTWAKENIASYLLPLLISLFTNFTTSSIIYLTGLSFKPEDSTFSFAHATIPFELST